MERHMPLDHDASPAEVQAALERAFPRPVKTVVDEVLEWRGQLGSCLIQPTVGGRPTSEYWFRPGRGYRLPKDTADLFSRWDSPEQILNRAQKLERMCLPNFTVRFQLPDKTLLALKRIVARAHNSAKKRAAKCGLEFKLNILDVENLLWDQGLCCAVSGLQFRPDAAGLNNFRAPFRPSIDRLNCRKGYVKGNIRLVLTIVNLALSDWGDETLVEVAKAIAARHS
jgi:hypothetical protein